MHDFPRSGGEGGAVARVEHGAGKGVSVFGSKFRTFEECGITVGKDPVGRLGGSSVVRGLGAEAFAGMGPSGREGKP